ncbi:hypothetical protein J437_LFUL017382 [Ladona fulva]|uniref:Adenylosuccinate synthetase n=1 Tax=Ladona fulva TaxID=123851 RepID=A0A8K0KNL7_LADFU|nr:hypothetical protein J437_LFUL017382 [Ladona fulva]
MAKSACMMNGNHRGTNGTTDKLYKVTVVVGAQWGDEGKGKVVDMLAKNADIVCRCQMQDDARIFLFEK